MVSVRFLYYLDGGPKGKADPAFDAHILPIGDCAKAVWECRLPRLTLAGMVARAKLRLVKAKNVWAKVN